MEGQVLVFRAAVLEEEEEVAAERCIEAEHVVRVGVVSSTLTVVVVVEGVCIPASEELSSLVEGCVEVARNVHGLSLRNAKHCEDHYNFCCVCSLPLCLSFLVLHCFLRAVGCAGLGSYFHLGSFQRPMRPRRRQRQAEVRQHSRWQRCLTSIVSELARLLSLSGSKIWRMQSQQ